VNRASVGVIAFVLVCLLTVVSGLAWTGGLRISSPIDSYKDRVEAFNMPSGSVETVETMSQRDHVCFLQCSAWQVTRSYRFIADTTPEEACVIVRDAAINWFSAELTELEPDSRIACLYRVRIVEDRDRRCESAVVYTALEARNRNADLRVRVSDCTG